jgi:hypothetical protein
MVGGDILGHTLMPEILKMGRPKAQVWNIFVASSTTLPTIGDSVISNTLYLALKVHLCTHVVQLI